MGFASVVDDVVGAASRGADGAASGSDEVMDMGGSVDDGFAVDETQWTDVPARADGGAAPATRRGGAAAAGSGGLLSSLGLGAGGSALVVTVLLYVAYDQGLFSGAAQKIEGAASVGVSA